jgi:hypothetical protein
LSYFGKPLPKNVSDVFDKKKYEQSIAYEKTKAKFSAIT